MTRAAVLSYLSAAAVALLFVPSARAQDTAHVPAGRPNVKRPAPPADARDWPNYDWADVAGRVPGFAGLYRHGDTLIIVLVDTTRLAEADREAVPTMGGRRAEFHFVRAQPARYDFRQLRDWKALVVAAAGQPATSWGIDVVRNAVVVSVARADDVARARERLLRLGIPAGALIIESQPPIRVP